MPNHCENTLVIKGTTADIQEFKNKIIEANKKFSIETEESDFADLFAFPFTFQAFIPKPEGMTQEEDYDWCVDNWGTKWDAYDSYVKEETPSYLEVQFLTAWAPPVEVVYAMQKQHPHLRITMKYQESGMLLAGSVTAEGVHEESEEHFFTAENYIY